MMKIVEFAPEGFNSDDNSPHRWLKVGNRVRWHDKSHDVLMFGDILSINGNAVTASDGKFGTDEKHEVSTDQMFEILEPRGGKMEVVWQKEQ